MIHAEGNVKKLAEKIDKMLVERTKAIAAIEAHEKEGRFYEAYKLAEQYGINDCMVRVAGEIAIKAQTEGDLLEASKYSPMSALPQSLF